MHTSSRPGEANVPAIILSVAVLVLCLAAAYYLIAVLPTKSSGESSSSASSVSSMMNNDGAMTDEASSSSVQLTAEQRAAYDGCINAATEAHTQRWTAACQEKRNTQESLFLACMQEKNDETYCRAQFGGYEDINATCDLGTVRMATLNAGFTTAKLACNRQYGL